mgnify:CR=1 FL=1
MSSNGPRRGRRRRSRRRDTSFPSTGTKTDGRLECGEVKWFSQKKGYGFIQCPDGSEVFVHESAVILGSNDLPLARGRHVEFEVRTTPRGKQAFSVVVLNGDHETEELPPPAEEPPEPTFDFSRRLPASWKRKPSGFVYTYTIHGRRNG